MLSSHSLPTASSEEQPLRPYRTAAGANGQFFAEDGTMLHLIKYKLFSMVWQRVLLICAGYADGNDSNFSRHDAAIKLAMGLGIGDDDYLASQPTISRLENNLTSKDCYRIAAYMVMAYISRKSKAPKEIVLDFDGSCVPVHGDQQGTSYRKYYDTNMYFPLFVYDEDGCRIKLELGVADRTALHSVSSVERMAKRAAQGKDPGGECKASSEPLEALTRIKAGWRGFEIANIKWCQD